MKKFIIVIISIMLLCGCARVSDVSQQVSTETTSEVSGTYSSEPISSDKSSQATSIETSTLSSEYEIPTRQHLELDIEYSIFIDKLLSYAKYYSFEQIGYNDKTELTIDIAYLIMNNFNVYRRYYLEPSIYYDGYNKISDNISKISFTQYTLTNDWLYESINYTYTKNEAESILKKSNYRGKRYHYFSDNNFDYIDQTVAKSEKFIPYGFEKYPLSKYNTYRYTIEMGEYAFDYEQVDETHIEIEVILYDLLDQKFVKLPLTAVLEDGKWKLEKMVLEEDIVSVG